MIVDPLQKFGDRLLSFEPTDTQLGERYRREISAMLHRGPGAGRRWIQIVCSLLLILLGLASALVILHADEGSLPSVFRLLAISSGIYMCVIGAVTLVCAIRRIDPLRYRPFWFGMALLTIVLLSAGLLNQAWETNDAGLRWQLTEVSFIVLGILGVGVVVHFIGEYHRRTELKLLELEYRLADLAARVRRE